jgi:Zn-dependent protease/CBS domain-containing protein
MTPTFRIGRIAGVEVGINWTWIFVVLLLTWSLAAGVFPQTTPGLADSSYLAMAAVAVLLFFACLLLHELGHAIRAQREGVAIEGITLWVFGGVARFRGQFPSAGAELRIALAGPVVSLVLGVIFLLAAVALPLPPEIDSVTSWLATVNLVLLAFNMLPALPLDGGRVLRATLWASKGDFVAATRIAAALGRLFAQLLIGGGFLLALVAGSLSGLWLALIGWFLLLAAEAEREAAVARAVIGGLKVRDVMADAPVTVDAELPLAPFMDDVFARSRHVAYPVVRGGEPVGLITFADVAELPRAAWAGRRVADRTHGLDEIVVTHPDEALEDAWRRLAPTVVKRALVLDDGGLAGLLSATDIVRLLAAAPPPDTRQRRNPLPT